MSTKGRLTAEQQAEILDEMKVCSCPCYGYFRAALDDIEALGNDHAELKRTILSDWPQQLIEARTECNTLRAQLEAANRDLDKRHTEYRNLSDANDEFDTENAALRARCEQLEQNNQDKMAALRATGQRALDAEAKIEQLEGDREQAIRYFREIKQASMGVPDQFGVDGFGYCNLSDCRCSNHLALAALAALSDPTDANKGESKT